MNNIELKAIKDLLGMNFYIPNYQRGYRWTHQQVRDLLEDINEFMGSNQSNIYCIQPLVIKRSPVRDGLLNDIKSAESIAEVRTLINQSDAWEVIDGQQRLTTIYIILKCLHQELAVSRLYSIEYATRPKSRNYLEKGIVNYTHNGNVDNIDFFHMGEAYCVVNDWFNNHKIDRQQFLQTLLNRVKFIWYEVDEKQNSKEIFQRLNLGKISLTNSELIKAIFLRSNQGSNRDNLSIMQISTEWDLIENALQNDEFWAFINTLDYESPTRIDYIFDIIRSLKILPNVGKESEIGDDEYATFRYFYTSLNDKKSLKEVWSKVYEVYDILNEWYNTSDLYHYIGFIVACTKTKSCEVVSKLIEAWIGDSVNKEMFVKNYLVKEIKKICKLDKVDLEDFLQKTYDMEGCPSKTECRPILLLHNIETIVQQNRCVDSISKFGNVFYRFPYNQYKASRKNIGWDVEHIDSNTENELRSQKDRVEYLKLVYLATDDEDIKQKIKDILSSDKDEIEDKAFGEIRAKVTDDKNLEGDDKNKIWNFALLDSKTNRGYGNSPFPAKRRVIIGKERGLKYSVDIKDNFKEVSSPESATFIPPCTRNAFLKYYTTRQATNLTAWLKEDAKAYQDDMLRVIGKFLEMAKE